MDTARYARFTRPGHAVTGDRSQRSRNWMRDETRVGYDFAHAIVDDHSRLAYVELLPDEKAATVTSFVERALAWFALRGIRCRRLMTDNASAMSATARCASCSTPAASSTSPPRPTGPAPTASSSASTRRWPASGPTAWPTAHTSTANKALPHWLNHYNERRPHSSIAGRPPNSRVHNLLGQDT
jgi:hypothetical protein